MSMRSLVLAVLACASVAVLGAQAPNSRDAASIRQKMAAINARALRPSKQPLRTVVTEGEANAYLLYEMRPPLPPGVVDPALTMMGDGRLSARAVVDLDAVKKANPPSGLLDPRNLLWGHLPVTAVGVLRATAGAARFELESASLGGVPIPKLLLQEIVSYYSKSPDSPSGVTLDNPFALPSGIREVQVGRGQALIVQ
jgi:hypothetical protein